MLTEADSTRQSGDMAMRCGGDVAMYCDGDVALWW